MRDAGRSTCYGIRMSFLFIISALLLSTALTASAGAAGPPVLWEKGHNCGDDGKLANGECGEADETQAPRGVATDSTDGDLYVSDSANRRVQQYTAWGQLLRIWGWDVVKSGPGDDTSIPEDQFEICVPSNGDICKAGTSGEGTGQFGYCCGPQGIATDASGNVYVVDHGNLRVQKFDSNGNFLLTFGGDVNKTKSEETATEAERNLCPIDPGDVCQRGVGGTGAGQFGSWAIGSFIAVGGLPETVYVGDRERIQRFGADGKYLGDLPDPEELIKGKTVMSLAADSSGNLFVAFLGSGSLVGGVPAPAADVLKLSPGGVKTCAMKVAKPTALAADSSGKIYVVDGVKEIGGVELQIRKFNGDCSEVKDSEFPFSGELDASTGVATSSPPTCGLDSPDLFVNNVVPPEKNFIRAYGSPPDPSICPPPTVPPTISNQHALSVDTDGATLRAKINPHFWPDTTYYLQYGTGKCSEGGCNQTALFPGSELTNAVLDADIATVGVLLTGLEPDTTYHYRFVAESSGGGPVFGEGEGQEERSFHTFPLPDPPSSDPCPNATFRTGASVRLPDCRAYEMVSPLDKNNADVTDASEAHAMASVGGGAFTYSMLATAYAEPEGAPLIGQYLSKRDPEAGWSTRSIAPPRTAPPLYNTGDILFERGQYKIFSEDLCSGWLVQDSDVALAPKAPVGVPNAYRRDLCGGAGYELLTTIAPPGYSLESEPSASNYYLGIQGTSADGSVSFFRAPAKLTGNAAGKGIYQVYVAFEGKLRLVSILPNGNASTLHSSLGTSQSLTSFRDDSVYHAVSADGSRVFWSTAPGVSGVGKLFVRVHPTQAPSKLIGEECTEAAKACTLPVSIGDALFHAAATDGSVALYSLADSLFEYDVGKAIAKEAGVRTLISKKVTGVVGASNDATRVYFVSREDLAGAAEGGKENLYLHERGEGFTFIATLSSADTSLYSKAPYARDSRVSPDGLHLAFTSTASLTGYDNADVKSGEPDAEVFVYDATASEGSGELLCASCNPSGARPSGRKTPGQFGIWVASSLPGWISQTHPGRVLSPDGGRLFFESSDALVPRDTNGRTDVYEWEEPGKGSCTEADSSFAPSNGGCLSLISSGESSKDSELIDASADGNDVFFATSSSLLVQDYGLRDVYDARVNGGFPPPPPAPPACEGEACQGTPSPPNDPTPSSSVFQGAGNVVEGRPGRCAKGKVRRRGRCVAKKQRRRAKHPKQQANDKRRAGR